MVMLKRITKRRLEKDDGINERRILMMSSVSCL